MARTPKHNWQKLFLEYGQGRYKSARQFAETKGLNYDRLKKEFKKLSDQGQNGGEKEPQNGGKKQGQKTGAKKLPPKRKGQNEHPWEQLKKQFTDWPEEKLQAYLMQLEARRAELEAIPFEELAPAEVKELGRVRQERRAILSDPDPEHKCSARNRDGDPCQNPVERGKSVCWNHGGAPGSGAQPGSQNALKHGFYAKIFPNDEETREIIEAITEKSPLDILWDQIVIQYTAIARAQKIMFVKDQDDLTKHLKRQKETSDPNSDGWEKEWELQYAWDKHANLLSAQSKAMQVLEKLIQRYDAIIQSGHASEEHRLRLEKMKQDMVIARERMDLEKKKAEADEDGDEKEIYVDTTIPGVDDEAGDQDD